MSSFLHRGTADLDSRYSFTAQFLRAAAFFSSRASDLELKAEDSPDDHVLMQHRGYIVSTVFQSVAALEADCFEVVEHGPGHHLGSNLNDLVARDFLRPLAEIRNFGGFQESQVAILVVSEEGNFHCPP